jgi:predicted aldo/keto reductase-like oxidoreductase
MPEGKNLSRRDFLRTAGMLGTGSLLGASGVYAQGAGKPPAPGQDAESSSVGVRPFGRTGTAVSVLSLGGMFDIPSNQLLLKQALKWGVTYWDTADCYEGGNSELGIGRFLNKYPEARKQLFLVTKSDARDPSGMTKLLNRSLERMKTDTIDLYFIHGVKGIDELNNETKAWVEKTKSEGKIKLFGFSTHSNMEDCMLAAAKLGWIDGIMMTYNFRLMQSDKMKSAVDACVRAGIGLTAMKTQGGGSVSMESETELQLAGRFLKQGFNDKQARLKAVWENPHIASICSQMPNLTILMSNIAAALNQTRLSADDLNLFDQFACETSSTYCAGCATLCESTLAAAPPIRDVLRCLMYFHAYGEKERARSLFAGLPKPACKDLFHLDFSEAEARCPQGVPIGRLMREASVLLA